MSLEENKRIIRRLYEADNKKDLSILDELIASDFYDSTFEIKGPEGYRQFELEFFRGFPDWQEKLKTSLLRKTKCGFFFLLREHIAENGEG